MEVRTAEACELGVLLGVVLRQGRGWSRRGSSSRGCPHCNKSERANSAETQHVGGGGQEASRRLLLLQLAPHPSQQLIHPATQHPSSESTLLRPAPLRPPGSIPSRPLRLSSRPLSLSPDRQRHVGPRSATTRSPGGRGTCREAEEDGQAQACQETGTSIPQAARLARPTPWATAGISRTERVGPQADLSELLRSRLVRLRRRRRSRRAKPSTSGTTNGYVPLLPPRVLSQKLTTDLFTKAGGDKYDSYNVYASPPLACRAPHLDHPTD